MARLRMLGDRVLVKASEAEQTRASGLVLPDVAQERPQRGTVLAVGPGVLNKNGTRVPLDLQEDDAILFSRYGGSEITVADEPLLVLRENDILAVIED